MQVSEQDTQIKLIVNLFTVTRDIANVLQIHCSSMTSRVLPYVANVSPNGLMELAERLSQKHSCNSLPHKKPPDHRPSSATAQQGLDQHKDSLPVGREGDAMAESAHGACTDQISTVLRSTDPALVDNLRLRARLHLEVLRIWDWCFFMLGTDHEQQATDALSNAAHFHAPD